MLSTTSRWSLLVSVLTLVACGGSDSSDDPGPGSAGGAAGTTSSEGGAAGSTGPGGSGQAGTISGSSGQSGSAQAGVGGQGGAAGSNDPMAPLDVFCKGTGPLLDTGDGGTKSGACPGDLASVTFRYGLCVCESYTSSGPLTTDAFDSDSNAPVTDSVSGSVGTNGSFTSSGDVNISGSLWVAGADGVTILPKGVVGAELWSEGPVKGAGTVSVGKDAWLNGDSDPSKLTVGGTLHHPIGSPVKDPCACEPADRIDVAGFIEKFKTKNENDLIKLAPGDLSKLTGSHTLTLPCGRYYVDEITGSSNLTLDVQGRVALFVGGDFQLAGTFALDLAPGAELDVFIGGDLTTSGAFGKGAEKTPARVRYYMAGDSIQMSGGATFGGNLYGPSAVLTLSGDAEVYGALFVKNVQKSGKLTIHYDEAILDGGDCSDGAAGAAGGPGQTTCESCNDCGNQACKNGTCGACESNTDCCSPLVCSNGVCTTIIQ